MTSTIQTDPLAYRWFAFLIMQPAVISQLSLENENAVLYKNLKKTVLKQKLLHLILFFVLMAGTIAQQYALYTLSFFFFYPNWKFSHSKRHLVSQISMKIINRDFTEPNLKKSTFFQICEKYSRDYSVPSFVDKTYISDKILRYTALVTIITLILIRPVPSVLFFFIAFFCVYILIRIILNTDFFYRVLK